MPRLVLASVTLSVCCALSATAAAAPLSLTLADHPDILVSFIDVTWDATAGELDANGFALELDGTGALNSPISGGTFGMTANIDATGTLLGGSFTIGGTVAALGYNSGTLLTGTLTEFGFRAGGGDPLEFLFTITGGDAAPMYLARHPLGGIILTGTGFTGDFTTDFDNLSAGPGSGSGVADVASIPLPAALWLFVPALLSLGALRRR